MSEAHSDPVWITHEDWNTCLFVRHLAHCLLPDKRLQGLPSLGLAELNSGSSLGIDS